MCKTNFSASLDNKKNTHTEKKL